MKEVDDTQPEECECGSRRFTRIYQVKIGDEHDRDHDNKHMEPVDYECVGCGKIQRVRQKVK